MSDRTNSPSRANDWLITAWRCHCSPAAHLLSPWERQFIAGLGRFRRGRLSEKQQKILDRIADKLLKP